MEPRFKIIRTLNFSYIPLKSKNSFYQKYPRQKKSSRLCLIAADRDSLKDLNSEKIKSISLDSKNSKNIQILNFPKDSEFPIEYKVNSSDKIHKNLSSDKIVINKSSRINDYNDSNRKIMKSEVYLMKEEPKTFKEVYWTKKKIKNKYDEGGDIKIGYSTLNRSREIELSYFPNNQNENIFDEIDSAPKKFFQETIPSREESLSNSKNLYEPLTPQPHKTTLSEFSDNSDIIKDFLDQQVRSKLKKKKKNLL